MRHMERLSHSLASLISWGLGLGITVACFRNVFWHSIELERVAAATACGERPRCSAQTRQFMRSPIGHTYEFVTPAGNVEVTCRREFILIGDYACALENSALVLPPSESASESASASVSAPRPAVQPAVSSKPRR
jgi:hypothetical protein